MSLALCVLYIKELLKVLSSLTKVRKKHSHFKKILTFFDYSDFFDTIYSSKKGGGSYEKESFEKS